MVTMYTPKIQKSRILFARKQLRLLPVEEEKKNVDREYKQHYEREDDIVLVATEKFRIKDTEPYTYASRIFLTNEDLLGTFWASDPLVWGVGENLSFNLGNQIVKVLSCGEDGDGYKVRAKMRSGEERVLLLSHRLPKSG